MFKPAAEFVAGDVLVAAGWERTVTEVLVEGESVTLRFTPPQDPDTWEYLTDDEGGQLEQPEMVTTVHDEFEARD